MKMQVPAELDRILREIGVGPRSVDDPFFTETHKVFGVFTSLGIYHADEEELCHPEMEEFTCNAPSCSATFTTLVEFEMHYHALHNFTCMECKKIRPTERLLDIHIEETHDSFFKVLAEKRPMYQCFVSDCPDKFSSPTDRQDHTVRIHKFPKNYRYDESLKRIQQEKKLSQQTKSKGAKSEEGMEVDPPKATSKNAVKPKPNIQKNQKCRTFTPSMNNFTPKSPDTTDMSPTVVGAPKFSVQSSSAALAFIPRQLTLKSYSKVLTKGKSGERNILDGDTMMELADALPE